jgi:hypothetical protein
MIEYITADQNAYKTDKMRSRTHEENSRTEAVEWLVHYL